MFFVLVQCIFSSWDEFPNYPTLIPKNADLGLKIDCYRLPRKKVLLKVLDLKLFNRFRKFQKGYKRASGLYGDLFRPLFWFFWSLPARYEESIITADNGYKYKPCDQRLTNIAEFKKYNIIVVGDSIVFSTLSALEIKNNRQSENSRFTKHHFSKNDISFVLLMPDRIRRKFSDNRLLNSLSVVSEIQGGIQVEKDEIFLEISFKPIEKTSVKKLNEVIKTMTQKLKSVIGSNKVVMILDHLIFKSSESAVNVSGKYSFEEFKHLDELLEIAIFWKFVNTLLQ